MPLPQYLGGSAGNRLGNITDFYLNYNDPNANPEAFYETNMIAAQNAQQAGGQQFSGARRGLLQRSQIMQNLAAATPILQFQSELAARNASQTQAEASDLAKLAQAGKQAEALERLSQLGRLESDTRAAAAQRADTILKGQQAIQQLSQTQMGDQILKQLGINAEKEMLNTKLTNDNWQFTTGNQERAKELALDRNWKTQENATSLAGQFKLSGLNNNAAMQRTRAASPSYNYDDNATTEMINGIIGRTSMNQSSPGNLGLLQQTANYGSNSFEPTQDPYAFGSYGAGGNSTNLLGSPQTGFDVGTGEGSDSTAGWSDDDYWKVYGGG